ncbi:hypothetical protein TTHERM_00191150 (macronuclear) [Tetrahymena thermophila SB210]|uniref:Transmembrane protein n=1 Tax=Tetrahymena thermophila (strain SB210) TaxID=312017 RepID=I7M1J2_TETTS|nr:hypothetical protein TTHERM_00191150 [Tetrahymena thermophila SB210]EAR96447.1 hypothetical protein TTHERM_00191150 [Tetrahymena thermophila SB210]|eukprot:XP_001016692.1 hypothetical protein TTHERM_00191150 [Tetrahymena thermophila SB210]
MKKILVICLIYLSISLAQEDCNSSCICNPGSNVCASCVQPDVSTMDQNNKSCQCNDGYYVSSISPFQCSQSIAGPSNTPTTPIDPCQVAIGTLTGNILVQTSCFMDVDPVSDSHTVISQFNLQFDSHSAMDDSCKAKYYAIPYYLPSGKNPKVDKFIPLDQPHWQVLSDKWGGVQMSWSLTEAYNYANSIDSTSDPNQFNHIIMLQMNIMVNGKVYRHHHYDVIVYTDRNEVQTFNVDVDIQRTQDCTGSCVIVADLDVAGYICADQSCSVQKVADSNGNFDYTVGDTFYAKIWFKDATFTKHLTLNRLYYMNQSGLVSDQTKLASSQWDNQSLIVTLPLVQPSPSNQIQVQMLIDPNSRLRSLQASSSSSTSQSSTNAVSQSFQFSVQGGQQVQTSTTYSASLLFGVLNLLALILLV